MSSRPQAGPTKVINNGDMSHATITSIPTIIPSMSIIGYGFSWAGTAPIGGIQIQVSNDYVQNPDGTAKVAGNWTTISFNLAGTIVTTLPVSGATGSGFANIDAMGAYAIRALYTRTSGTGTLQAVVTSKVA